MGTAEAGAAHDQCVGDAVSRLEAAELAALAALSGSGEAAESTAGREDPAASAWMAAAAAAGQIASRRSAVPGARGGFSHGRSSPHRCCCRACASSYPAARPNDTSMPASSSPAQGTTCWQMLQRKSWSQSWKAWRARWWICRCVVLAYRLTPIEYVHLCFFPVWVPAPLIKLPVHAAIPP